MSNLVWLFSGYREAIQKIQDQELEILKLKLVIDQLSKTMPTTSPASVESLLKEFQDMILSEQPYPDGKIPENAYLTPGE